MIIKLDKFNNYVRENKPYNDDIRGLVHEIFTTDSLGKIKYMISDINHFKSNKRRHLFIGTEGNQQYHHPQDDESNYKNYQNYNGKLGPLEYSLTSYILNSTYNVIIFTGALGSGKTTVCENIFDFLKKDGLDENDPLYFPKNGIIYPVNFNQLAGNDKEDTANLFKRELAAQMISVITRYHRDHLFINDLLEKIDSNVSGQYVLFDEWARKLRKKHLTTEEQKFEDLLDWLGQEDLSFKLRIVSYILNYIQRSRAENGRADFILFLDNIDNFTDNIQMNILHIIFSFSVKLPIKVVLPMRLTTFGKIHGNGSYSFGVYPNAGQDPLRVFSERINHFLDNPEDYNLSRRISAEHLPKLLEKFRFIAEIIKERNSGSRLASFFTAIAGNSIRRGLLLGERFFLNSNIRWNDSNLYQDDFTRSLLISESATGKMSNNDNLVLNLYCSQSGGNECTLLNVRILQILSDFKDNGMHCKMSVLLSQLELFEEYDGEEIRDAINNLIFYRRRLAYVEGVNDYSDTRNLYQSMGDIIQITYSGTEYLNTLMFDIVYLQNSFMILNWRIPKSMRTLSYVQNYLINIDKKKKSTGITYLLNLIQNKASTITDFIPIAYDFDDIRERMKMIRECLNFLLIHDLNQLAIYFENNDLKATDAIESRYIKNSIIIDAIGRIATNVLHILKGNDDNAPEIKNWYDFLIIADLWQKEIFQCANQHLESSLALYNRDKGMFF